MAITGEPIMEGLHNHAPNPHDSLWRSQTVPLSIMLVVMETAFVFSSDQRYQVFGFETQHRINRLTPGWVQLTSSNLPQLAFKLLFHTKLDQPGIRLGYMMIYNEDIIY